jgi:DeoR/GlpR family transcriptional regulator of sugar metabolism
MGLTKEQTAGYRQSRILQMVSKPGGVTSAKLAEYFKVSRSLIINDIRALRAKGYPIQTSSMVTEGGIYTAVFEMARIPEKSSKSTPAASAE